MKKLNLVFVFALMGVLFFACQKDERVVDEIAGDSNEMLSVERSGITYAECQDSCLIKYRMCCCTIEWLYYDSWEEEYFEHPSYYQFWPMPEFCAAEDITETEADCFITHTVYDEVLEECVTFTTWNSTLDYFNPPYWGFALPTTPRPTYKCVAPNTAMSIKNPFNGNPFIEIHVTLTCVGADGMPKDNYYEIPGGETFVIEFSGCEHDLDCLSKS